MAVKTGTLWVKWVHILNTIAHSQPLRIPSWSGVRARYLGLNIHSFFLKQNFEKAENIILF